MNGLKEWWNAREARERRTLTIGAVALAVMIFLFGIWLPTHRGVDSLRNQLASQRANLAWMQQAAAEVQALQASGASPTTALGGQSLFALVDQSARQAGLGSALRQVEPTGDQRARVNLQQASFDTLVSWLVNLRARHGIEATVMSARRAEGAGRVNVQLELEGQAQ